MPKPSDTPESISALRRAFAAWQRGDMASAEFDCRRAIALGNDGARAWTLLGIALQAHDPAAAEEALCHAARQDPAFPDAQFQLGNLRRLRRDFPGAIEAYQRALALAPGNASVMNNLALAIDGNGERLRAVDVWREAVRVEPGHRQARANLAHALTNIGRFAEASILCAGYLRDIPDAEASIWADWAVCLQHLRDYKEADRCYRRALQIEPGDPAILVNFGSMLVELADYAGAIAVFARADAPGPLQLYAMIMTAYCRQRLAAWDGLATSHEAIRKCLAGSEGDANVANPFVSLSIPMPAAMQLKIAREWTRSRVIGPSAIQLPPISTPRSRGRLRLGYLSSDFRTHPVAYLLSEVWESHDRERFETFAYSIGPTESSSLRKRIEGSFGHFADCVGEPAQETALRIREDDIDILIDLNGYTTFGRTEIVAARPARVQISWLGYLGSMGAEFIDYVLTDRIVTPSEEQAHFAERFLYLPHCYCPSDTRRIALTLPPSREACGLPPAGFVFSCFNSVYKILPSVFDAWMRLLGGVPESVLWLAPDNAEAGANLRREAARRGIDPSRVVFAPIRPLTEHLARYCHADLFLDTTPYGAGTTANDALLMGVPVVSVLGNTMSGRVAASQLSAIGLPDLITADMAEYESAALRIATHPDELSALRSRLRNNRQTHPLFDMASFTHDLEKVLASVATG